jgi:hypothetical protein
MYSKADHKQKEEEKEQESTIAPEIQKEKEGHQRPIETESDKE